MLSSIESAGEAKMSRMGSTIGSVVYIIDDDDIILEMLKELVETIGVEVKAFSSARDFLDTYRSTPCECLISDIRMPEIGGLEVQRALLSTGKTLPIIFISGYSEIRAAVEAMKQGAYDFVEKPVNGHMLLEKVQGALAKSRELNAQRIAREVREARLALLTPKEREIVELVIKGQSSRNISDSLGISVRTVENHRSRIMEKLHVNSAVELVNLFIAPS
jgi:FixJ family two-component response regulator